jgi:phosphoribosylaminoimidazolecarboxamide formyltransferase/IMP cyclohydrolase
MKKTKRALISVYDKTNILEFAKKLNELGYEIVSTGGTYKILKENSIDVIEVSQITGFEEIMDGRVKTLHPNIHAAILARRDNQSDLATLEKMNVKPIEIVAVNLYPFFEKQKLNLSEEELTEFIDIGGPTMLRAAAKNYKDVIVIVDPKDYEIILEKLAKDEFDIAFRKKLASKVFSLTSAYDAAIANFLGDQEPGEYSCFSYKLSSKLRYGENPHQQGWLYLSTDGKGIFNNIEILNGKELSYNNIKDIDSAVKIAYSFEDKVIVAVKHNVPCAVAKGDDNIEDLFEKLYNADSLSIFGGIIVTNQKIEKNLAEKLTSIFLEVIVSPNFSEEAIEILKKKKNLRVIKLLGKPADSYEFCSVDGAVLIQQVDNFLDNENAENFKIVTEKKPNEKQIKDLIFAQRVSKFVKSNAIVTAKDGVTCGICGGQTSRIWAAQNALSRTVKGAVLASDGFFPFTDVVEEAFKYGISAIIQPGGSLKDKDSIDLCNKYGIPMVFTGVRHFKH